MRTSTCPSESWFVSSAAASPRASVNRSRRDDSRAAAIRRAASATASSPMPATFARSGLECLDIGRHVHGRHYDISVMSCQAKNGVIAESSRRKPVICGPFPLLTPKCSTFDTLSRSERAPKWGQTRRSPPRTGKRSLFAWIRRLGTVPARNRHAFGTLSRAETGSSGFDPTGSPSRLKRPLFAGIRWPYG